MLVNISPSTPSSHVLSTLNTDSPTHPDHCSTPIRREDLSKSFVEDHHERGRHRNPSVSTFTPSRRNANFDAHHRNISSFAQIIARDQIFRQKPIFYYNAHTDRASTAELRKHMDVEYLMNLSGKHKLDTNIGQENASPFSRDILIRAACEGLIDGES